MDNDLKKKKRRGNIMIVVAMMLIIFPVVLILANMGGSGLKLLVQNKNYHQSLLTEDSIKLATKEAIKLQLQELTFPMQRDSTFINGVRVYGNYYISPMTIMDIDGMKDKLKNKQSLYTVFGIDTLVVEDLIYDENLTTSFKRELPFQHTMNISCTVKTQKSGKTTEYLIDANVIFNVNANVSNGLAYISGIDVISIKVIPNVE